MKLHAWILASRPKTLSAAVAPVIVGTALAYRDQSGDLWWRYAVLALAGAVLIQIATNFINDAIDYKKGADTRARLGPVRVTQAGLLKPEVVMRGAFVALVLAAVCGIPLIYRAGWPLLVVGLLSLAMAYLYTGGPYPLAYHGLGEIFVLLFFGLIAVGGTYYVLTLDYSRDALISGIAVGSLAVAILAINNVRDLEGDRAVGKRTMAVRVGPRAARGEVIFSILLPFALMVSLAVAASDFSFLSTLAALPLAVALIGRVNRSIGKSLNRCLAMAGALQWMFAIAFAVGVVWRVRTHWP